MRYQVNAHYTAHRVYLPSREFEPRTEQRGTVKPTQAYLTPVAAMSARSVRTTVELAVRCSLPPEVCEGPAKRNYLSVPFPFAVATFAFSQSRDSVSRC